MAIVENKERLGAFTSSQIYRLMSNGQKAGTHGKPFFTYIEEKRAELRLGRSFDLDTYTRSMAWGELLEAFVFEKFLGLNYKIVSNKTVRHPDISNWSGSPDLIILGEKVSDIKCYEPKNFCAYVDCMKHEKPELLKKEFPQEYWQLISNAAINKVKNVEAICYMPYENDLQDIRDYAENYDGDNQWRYRFIAESDKSKLPYIPNNNEYYQDINMYEFEAPEEDIDLLTARVIEAQKLLLA